MGVYYTKGSSLLYGNAVIWQQSGQEAKLSSILTGAGDVMLG